MQVLKGAFQAKEMFAIFTHLNYYICFYKVIRVCIYNTNNIYLGNHTICIFLQGKGCNMYKLTAKKNIKDPLIQGTFIMFIIT